MGWQVGWVRGLTPGLKAEVRVAAAEHLVQKGKAFAATPCGLLANQLLLLHRLPRQCVYPPRESATPHTPPRHYYARPTTPLLHPPHLAEVLQLQDCPVLGVQLHHLRFEGVGSGLGGSEDKDKDKGQGLG